MLRAPDVSGRARDVVSFVFVVALVGCGVAEAGSRSAASSPPSLSASASASARPPAPDPASHPAQVPDPGPAAVTPLRPEPAEPAEPVEPTEAAEPAEAVEPAEQEAPAGPVEILFVGNSYTHFNDMPELLSKMADAAGVDVEIDAYTVGGAKLVEHAANHRVHRKLGEREWDYVVLQAHSLEVFRNREGFDEAMDELTTEVAELGAEPVTFETWARREGHNVLRWYDLTPETMQDTLLDAYAKVAERNGARLAPVGEAWRRVHHERPDAGLHLSDGSHPSIAGSYLTACVFLNVLLDRRCAELGHQPEQLEPELAALLGEAADDTCQAG